MLGLSSDATAGLIGAGVSALVGLITAGLVHLAALGQSKRELKSRLAEKVLDRRIDAHLGVLDLAKTLRVMFRFPSTPPGVEGRDCPTFLLSVGVRHRRRRPSRAAAPLARGPGRLVTGTPPPGGAIPRLDVRRGLAVHGRDR